MNIVVRPVSKNEIGKVYELEKNIFQPINYPQFVLKQFYDLMPDLFLVAVNEENEVLGYVQGGRNIESEVGWVLSLATKPECRGKGIWRMLSEKVIALLRKKGAKSILLTVHPENKSAIHLYEKLDFTTDKIIEDYYGDGEPRWVMSYSFNGRP